jgi:putative ABC transport system permease protein
LTVGVLMIGVVMTVSVGAMSISFQASMGDWMNAVLGGDFIITSTDPMRDDLMRDIEKVPGIAGVTPERWLFGNLTGIVRGGTLENRQDPVLLIGIDAATRRAISTFQFMGGEDPDSAMDELASGDSIFVSTALRDRWNIRRGDMVRLRTTRGEHDFRVVAIAMSFMQGGQSMITSRRDLEKYFGDTRVSMFMANKAPEASSSDVEERLKNGIAKSKRLVIQAGDEYRQSLATQVQQFFLMFDAMVWIAVIVGALGVVNTMTMNVLERVREIGTLRSIGTTRGQVMGMILSEAAAMGVLGALFGVLVALPISREGVTRMAEISGFPMSYLFPPGGFVAGVVIALVVSQLAALYPTWRAVRLNVIEAIKEE